MKDKPHDIARDPKCDEYQGTLASMDCKFFVKKTWLGAIVNEDLAQEIRKTMIN